MQAGLAFAGRTYHIVGNLISGLIIILFLPIILEYVLGAQKCLTKIGLLSAHNIFFVWAVKKCYTLLTKGLRHDMSFKILLSDKNNHSLKDLGQFPIQSAQIWTACG